MKPTVGSLFAGIGGFDLGFERAGFETAWQVEINPWCRKVLAKNFPKAERYVDIRECCGLQHEVCGRDGHLAPVDVIVGGFPCQDISNAGLRAGIEGERSGLWGEMCRIIGELRPRYVLVENVAALLGRGMGRVLGDLAAIGYDAEWEIVSAADVKAPHLRERVWILAYPAERSASGCEDVPDTNLHEHQGGSHADEREAAAELSADAICHRGAQRLAGSDGSGEGHARVTVDDHYARGGSRNEKGVDWWAVEPNVGRVAHGVPARVDRLRGLGNAVVPQIPEIYARQIKALLAQGQQWGQLSHASDETTAMTQCLDAISVVTASTI